MSSSTTEAQKANLARIRDNQRRSRARRREYLAELENRLRTCELQGIEASTEVQVAARRVAEENRQLRELLHKQGFSDDYIAHFLQSGSSTQDEVGAPPPPSLAGPSPSPAVQALQQTLVPRRPASLDAGAPLSMAGHSSRETSAASVSTAGGSSVWESPSGVPHYSHSHQQGPPSLAMPQQGQHQFPPAGYADNMASRPHAFPGPPQGQVMEDPQQNYATGPISAPGSSMSYSVPMNYYNTPTTREYEPRSAC